MPTLNELQAAKDAALSCIAIEFNWHIAFVNIEADRRRAVAGIDGGITDDEAHERICELVAQAKRILDEWDRAVPPCIEAIHIAAQRTEALTYGGRTFASDHQRARACVEAVLSDVAPPFESMDEAMSHITEQRELRLPLDTESVRAGIELEHAKAAAAQPGSAEQWITREQAANIIGIDGANVGRQAGPKGSDKPIIDNGETGKTRRFDRDTVCEFAANRNAKTRGNPGEVESDGEVWNKLRQAGL